MAKRMTIMIVVLAVVFGGIFYFLGYLKPKMMGEYFANFQPPPVTVSSESARTEKWTPFYSSIGNVVAVQQVTVTSEEAGVIKSMPISSGAQVNAGDLLVQLDTDVDVAEIKGMQASAELAEATYKRDQKLLERNVASSLDFETSRAQLKNAQAQVESQRARINKKSIRAPFKGTLGIRKVNLGEYVQPGTPIVTLQDLSRVYVNFALPEQLFSQVHNGLQVEAKVAAFPERTFNGKVTAIDARVDQQTRNFTIQATFENSDQALRPGMFAEVKLLLGSERDVITVPSTALEAKLYGTSVFVISKASAEGQAATKDAQENMVVERRYVETGLSQNNWTEITKGLEPGESVVTAGQLKLQNGSRVKINNNVELR
ncbi:efflux RND transporter periplasmic adaptor subunit [Hahella sp. CR1]|uniref:efflux RND transporter periplasmic adaptor subunit n=1 Tax=Hahella sp. CR1 TaxID=2992807 RepID=UPI002441CDFA|nr:efflux RND transporter periplasmic adaptor subunit [Hahella sp. CR1]MDG9671896.1 efflux RND transporter periplasmic adaptor subunit [Hahella sp. CR1]